MEAENDDIRSALDAAVTKAETPEAPPPPETPPPSPETAVKEQAPIGKGRNEKGQFVKAEEEEPPKEPEKAAEPPKVPAPPAAPPQPQFAKEGARAPQSWRPAAREKFAALPPEVQEEAIRLDKEIRRTMQETAAARQNDQKFREIFTPAEPFLRSMNLDQHTFTRDALQTAYTLATAPQPMKAQAIARLIQIYGVDIQALDQALAPIVQGGFQPSPQQPPRDPRVDDLLRTVEQARTQRAQQLEEQARDALSEIENLEFYEDLRMDIADLLDLAANRGVALTAKEAYNRAAAMNPEISQVLKQREEYQSTQTPSGTIERAKAAASSVKGSSGSITPTGEAPEDMRGEIVAAWEKHSQR